MLNNKQFIVGCVILIVILFSVPAMAEAYIGCEIQYWSYSNTYGVISSQTQICDDPDSICRWFPLPDQDEDCEVRICFASSATESEYPVLIPTNDPAKVEVACGYFVSLPVFLQAPNGNDAWYNVCENSACPTLPATDALKKQAALSIPEVQAWVNGEMINAGFVRLRCRC